MTNYKMTLALTKLPGAELVEDERGKKCVRIPVEENDIFLTEKGGAYISFVMWLNRNGADQKGNTHTVKLSTGQEYAQRYPQYAGQNAQILGGMKPMIPKGQQGGPTAPYQQTGFRQQPPSNWQSTSPPK